MINDEEIRHALLGEILQTKHLLLIGGERADRLRWAEAAAQRLQQQGYQCITLPPDIATFSDYFDIVRKLFPISSPTGATREEMSFSQLRDMHLDWVDLGHRTCIFWPEIAIQEEQDLVQLLGDFVTEKFFLDEMSGEAQTTTLRLVATRDMISPSIFQQAQVFVGGKEGDLRTASEIWRQHLAIVDLAE